MHLHTLIIAQWMVRAGMGSGAYFVHAQSSSDSYHCAALAIMS